MVTIWSQRVLLKSRALIGTESILEDFAMTLTSDFTPHPWSNKHSLGLVQGRYGKWEEKSAQTKILHRGSTITLTFDIETWFWFKHIIYQQALFVRYQPDRTKGRIYSPYKAFFTDEWYDLDLWPRIFFCHCILLTQRPSVGRISKIEPREITYHYRMPSENICSDYLHIRALK